MKEKVEKALAKVKPMLAADGGGIELVEVDEANGIVKVKLTGACGCCAMAQMTMQAGVEKTIKQEVPEVKQVVSVE